MFDDYLYTKDKNARQSSSYSDLEVYDNNDLLEEIFNAANEYRRITDDMLNSFKSYTMSEAKTYADDLIDSLGLQVLNYMTGKDIVTTKYFLDNISQALDTKNLAIIVCAYFSGVDIFLGNVNKKVSITLESESSGSDGTTSFITKEFPLPPIYEQIGPELVKPKNEESSSSSDSEDGASEQREGYVDGILRKTWDERDNWNFMDFCDRWIRRTQLLGEYVAEDSTPSIGIFTKPASFFVMYNSMQEHCKHSRYDDELDFPFIDAELNTHTITYAAPFGYRESSGIFHRGVDFICDEGTPIHAVSSGTIIAAGDSWGSADNALIIEHDPTTTQANDPKAGNSCNNQAKTYSRYLHCSKLLVKKGQHVNKGQIVAEVGKFGAAYVPHLHLEISEGNGLMDDSTTDPLTYYPNFNVQLDGQIKPF